MNIKSSLLRFVRTMNNFWLTNRDNKVAVINRANGPIIHRPPGPPTAMYIPLGFKTRRHANNEWLLIQSKIRSYCCPLLVKSSCV